MSNAALEKIQYASDQDGNLTGVFCPLKSGENSSQSTCNPSQIEIYSFMHVISRKALTVFWKKYPDSKKPLLRWFKTMNQTTFKDFNALRLVFSSADKVDDLVVFNIAGNNYRLIASVHFNRKKIYVRHVLTHKDYDKGDWKK